MKRQDKQRIFMAVMAGLMAISLLLPMVATFGASGLLVGVVGSWTSIRKFMNV